MTPDQQFWCNWWVNVALAVASFLVVLGALFGDVLRARLVSPRFRLAVVRKEGEKAQLRDGAGQFVDDVRYYHLRVSNERRQWITAKDVQVYLTRIEEPGPDDTPKVTWTGNIPIRWRDQEFVPLTRTVGSAADCDLCRVEKKNGLFLMPLIVPHNLSANRHTKCKLTLHLQVRSTRADSEIRRIGIYWDGFWEDGDAEMTRHLVVKDDLPPERG